MDKNSEEVAHTDPYLLSRNAEEGVRLKSQHDFIVKCACDGRLIVDESLKFQDDAMILDAGTGTGVWLLDLSQKVPMTVSLHGIDMSGTQFPTQDIPTNVQLAVMKITDIPDAWSTSFDFIQQRYLITGLPAAEWPTAISKYLHILKPGGHVQFIEPWPRARAVCGPAGERIIELQAELYDRKGLLFDCAQKLPSLLQQAGFTHIRAVRKLVPVGDILGEDGSFGKLSSAGSIRGMGKAMVESGVIGSIEELELLVTKHEQEWEDAGGFLMTYWIVTAEKPRS